MLLFLLAACGDGVVDGTYPGEQLFELGGLVRYEGGVELPDAPLYVTVLWEPLAEDGYSWLPPLEVETTFPARYALSLYAPPPEHILADAVGQPGGGPVGAVVLFADEGDDGTFDPDQDALAGGTDEVVLLYLSEEWTAEAPAGSDAPDPVTFEPGYHAVSFDGGCPGEGPARAEDAAAVDLYVSDAGDAPLFGCGPP